MMSVESRNQRRAEAKVVRGSSRQREDKKRCVASASFRELTCVCF